jgi:hypothetical protein
MNLFGKVGKFDTLLTLDIGTAAKTEPVIKSETQGILLLMTKTPKPENVCMGDGHLIYLTHPRACEHSTPVRKKYFQIIVP